MSVYGIDLLQNNLSLVQNSNNLCIFKIKYKDKVLDKLFYIDIIIVNISSYNSFVFTIKHSHLNKT